MRFILSQYHGRRCRGEPEDEFPSQGARFYFSAITSSPLPIPHICHFSMMMTRGHDITSSVMHRRLFASCWHDFVSPGARLILALRLRRGFCHAHRNRPCKSLL